MIETLDFEVFLDFEVSSDDFSMVVLSNTGVVIVMSGMCDCGPYKSNIFYEIVVKLKKYLIDLSIDITYLLLSITF